MNRVRHEWSLHDAPGSDAGENLVHSTLRFQRCGNDVSLHRGDWRCGRGFCCAGSGVCRRPGRPGVVCRVSTNAIKPINQCPGQAWPLMVPARPPAYRSFRRPKKLAIGQKPVAMMRLVSVAPVVWSMLVSSFNTPPRRGIVLFPPATRCQRKRTRTLERLRAWGECESTGSGPGDSRVRHYRADVLQSRD